MLEVYFKYILSKRAKLSPTCLAPILVTSSPIVISLLLLSSRSLFRTRKLVKYLPKLYVTGLSQSRHKRRKERMQACTIGLSIDKDIKLRSRRWRRGRLYVCAKS